METNKSLYGSSLKTGLIIGAVSIVVFLISYVLDIKPVGFMKPLLILFIGITINIVLLVILFKKYRTETGGFISFKNAFIYCFIAFGIAVLVSQLFSYLFVQIIEPEYYKNIMEAQRTFMENYLTGKIPDEQIAEQLDKMDEKMAEIGSISTLLKNTLGSIVFGGIVALIVAAIMKKKPEMFETTDGGAI